MKKLLSVSGILMLVYGLSLVVFTNFTLGTVLTLMLGAGLSLSGIYYEKIKIHTQSGFLKYIKIAICTLFIAEIIFVAFLVGYGMRDTADYKEDAVVVLGAGIRGDKVSYALKYRLDKAIEYHHNNPDAIIVVSGGQGAQESVTEAYAMEKYLTQNGVDKKCIIKEEKSTSTNENMRFSKAILDEIFHKDYRIVVITNNFHIYRGVRIAHNEGFVNVSRMGCRTTVYDSIPSYLRETLAVLKLWVIG